uniref:MFS transporter n=1 Tax=Janibacter limosus TaxID=53458 RepID=A0AC61U887_9MICO|nr:MFS transporter [Janibacter limosus]
MLVAVPVVLTESGWSGTGVGMLLLPCAALGVIAPRVTGPALIALGAARSQLIATTGTAAAVALAALGAARVDATMLVVASLILMMSFGLGQPAMTALVADSVPAHTRGGALGLLTLVFLLGGSMGAAAVGGLGEVIGLPRALLVVAVLPATAAPRLPPPPSRSPSPTPGDPVTDTDHVLYDLSDGIATITLNRPDRRNAMSVPMIERLGELLAQTDEDPDVRVLVLTGAGRAFCSGGDVQQFDADGGEGGGATEVDPAGVADQLRHRELTVGRPDAFTKPTIAALPGAAAGAGLGLALATDLRIGTPRTVVATAFAAVALSGDFGVAWLLDRLVGPARARELMLLGPRLDGQACLDLGLLNRLVPEDELVDGTRALATQLADGPGPAPGEHQAQPARGPPPDAVRVDGRRGAPAQGVRPHGRPRRGRARLRREAAAGLRADGCRGAVVGWWHGSRAALPLRPRCPSGHHRPRRRSDRRRPRRHHARPLRRRDLRRLPERHGRHQGDRRRGAAGPGAGRGAGGRRPLRRHRLLRRCGHGRVGRRTAARGRAWGRHGRWRHPDALHRGDPAVRRARAGPCHLRGPLPRGGQAVRPDGRRVPPGTTSSRPAASTPSSSTGAAGTASPTRACGPSTSPQRRRSSPGACSSSSQQWADPPLGGRQRSRAGYRSK